MQNLQVADLEQAYSLTTHVVNFGDLKLRLTSLNIPLMYCLELREIYAVLSQVYERSARQFKAPQT